jgi:uncharacterized membrane protein YeiH
MTILLSTRLPAETEAYIAFRIARITHCYVANPTAFVRSLLTFFDSIAIGAYALEGLQQGTSLRKTKALCLVLLRCSR